MDPHVDVSNLQIEVGNFFVAGIDFRRYAVEVGKRFRRLVFIFLYLLGSLFDVLLRLLFPFVIFLQFHFLLLAL